jgi:hypothetical protein
MGSYLSTHWNTADSGWLVRTVVTLVPPTPRFVPAAIVTASAVPTSVTFAAVPPVAGVESVVLQRRVNVGAWTAVGAPGPGATSRRLDLAPGHRHRFRVRSIDADGLASAWMTGASRQALVRQESSSMIHWSGGWKRQTVPSALGGKLKWSSAVGAAATFTTSATDVAIVAARGPNRGRMEVWVDGVRVRTIDLYAPAAQPRRIVDARHFATAGPHTVRLRATGTRNAASSGKSVALDAVLLLTP